MTANLHLSKNKSVRIGQKVERLILLAEKLAGSTGALSESCYQLLDADSSFQEYLLGASCLNNDGSPLQLCLSSSKNNTSLRIIGDPGAYHKTTEERYQSSVKTLLYFMEEKKSQNLIPITKKTIKALLPNGIKEREVYKQGFIWIAISPNHPGIAFYLELAPLGYDRGWNAVEQWLDEILPTNVVAKGVLEKLKKYCVVASAGLEGSEVSDARAKIYFRFREATSVDLLDIDLFSSKEMYDFLSIAMGPFEVELNGFVMNVGFDVKTGNLADVKIDLCGHCLRYRPDEWVAKIQQLNQRFSLEPLDTNEILQSEEYQVAFLGFGLSTDYKPRLNLYLKHEVQVGKPESDEIWSALQDAATYLQSIQKEDGSWEDYHLPVGRSDQWVTAYTAHALAQYGFKTVDNGAILAAKRAAQWLLNARTYESGWGYNGFTGPDSDSTAMAIALFDELGMTVPDNDRKFLRDHWVDGDCFATYQGPGAWGVGHWDITPWAYYGLSHNDKKELYNQFLEALSANQMNSGFWRSYWWKQPYYCTFVTLEILDKLGIPEPDLGIKYTPTSHQIENPFDLACFIGQACIRNPSDGRIANHIRALINWQEKNGRWYGAANLRVTDNFCYKPWENPSGAYYDDTQSTITTATVMRVLSKIMPATNLETQEISYHWM
ncbi:MAG: prenyltransferase/squalene oxidase repeat-containing protein [Saprospiraceae bacterium]